MRETVVMYRSLRDATKELPKEIRAEVYDAVMDYAFDGVEPELTGVAKAMFLIIKPLIDKNNQRYENGCKGGRPKSNQKETETKPKNNQTETKVEPNDNDNVNVNVKKEKQVKEKVDEEKDLMLIDDNFYIDEDRNPEFKKAIQHAGKEQVDSLWSWLTEHRYGQTISKKWIINNLLNKPKAFTQPEKEKGVTMSEITRLLTSARSAA